MYHVDIYKHGGGYGVKIVGTESKPRKQGDKRIELPNYQGQGGVFGDFVACVKNRTKPVRDVGVSHRTSSVFQLANIAFELNRPLKWDPEKEEFKGDEEANGLRRRVISAALDGMRRIAPSANKLRPIN